MPEKNYDIIIVGAGAAGLSLIYHIVQEGMHTGKRILLLDKIKRTKNDRTWCFWQIEDSPFESIVFKKWDRLNFYTHSVEKNFDIRPYAYKMIRSHDFYSLVYRTIGNCPEVEFVLEDVTEITDQDSVVHVRTSKEVYKGNICFNSLPPDLSKITGKYHLFLQHFLGWVVKTEHDAFDPTNPVFMDFRVEQHDETRFVYVLPFNEKEALVEYTVFGKEVLHKDEYESNLRSYLSTRMGFDEYQIEHREFGVIPMTDATFETKTSKYIIPIGILGGNTKASTGYTFSNIQRTCAQIVKALRHNNLPTLNSGINSGSRFKIYDATLLYVLENNLYDGEHAFEDIFTKNDPVSVLRFLDDQSNFMEELKIMNSVPKIPFLKGAAHSMAHIFR